MPTQQRDKQHTDREKREGQQLNTVIGKHVMDALGRPGDLYGIHVRELWEDHYRVNILVGPDAASVKIAHSFFLVADGAGNVSAATPKITRKY